MMKIKYLGKIKIPSYTRGEEIFNMTSHIVGGGVGIVGLVLCIVFSALKHDTVSVLGSIIYGISMILLYTCSSIYHGLSPDIVPKKIFRVIDHCSIFLLIAGTYTPICLSALRGFDPTLAYTLLFVNWAAAVIGIIFNSIDLERFKILSGVCYLAMGWSVLGAYKALGFMIERGGVWLLLLGGIAYSVGAIFYYFFKKKIYMHSVFHIFVVLGSILHLLYILIYVI